MVTVITISVVELMDTCTLLWFVCLWHHLHSQVFCLFTVFSVWSQYLAYKSP